MYAASVSAIDLPKVDNSAMSLDVTETSIVAQRFEARQGEAPADQGYFSWLNRLNAVLTWKKWTVGLRIDSSVYTLIPDDPSAAQARSTRYRNAVYPAKGWVTYRSGILEATAGDSYVTFGRGLVLSLRKVDELGIDTTLFGAKVTLQQDPFSFTAIAGFANPARVDEPTNATLFLADPIGTTGAQPVFGNDRIFGAQIQGGRGLPVVASTHAAFMRKCSPYTYTGPRTINDDFFDAPFGTCDDTSVNNFLATLPDKLSPIVQSKETVNAGQSVEIPSLGGHGSIYVEAAVQQHDPWPASAKHETSGNAVYGSFVANGGPVTNTLEFKSYRNYFPLAASVNTNRVPAFAAVAYSAPPTAEVVDEDAEFNAFNTCVTGGRDRLDYRVSDGVIVWSALGLFETRGEGPGAECDRFGHSLAPEPKKATNDVVDVSAGAEIRFDEEKSIAFLSAKFRNDQTEADTAYYREYAIRYSITKHLTGPYALELAGRHRHRQEDTVNVRTNLGGDPWREGEHYTALKIAPKWIFSQGFEYTTLVSLPTYYFNGSILYKFTSKSNIRAYVGQNRGGLRCTNGICRFLPAFSGARVELTLRF
jgi:hypothetical protein